MLLLFLLGSIWLAIASVTYALAVAASAGDAVEGPAFAPELSKLAVCHTCLTVIERPSQGEGCPACGGGRFASRSPAAFARIPT